MSRMIDADEIKIPSTCVDMFENCRNCKLLDEEQVREIIDSTPTAAVNCIDCRLCSERGGHANCNGYLICTNFNRVVDEDTYCAWGERK